MALSEKSAELREDGAALFLWENGLRVLEQIGALDAAVSDGTPLTFWESVDERNRRLFSGIPSPQERVTCLRRDSLHGALVAAARKAGVEIRTGCEVTGATPDGRVQTADGELPQADLVVGADGFNSRVRESLGLTKEERVLASQSRRLLVPRSFGDPSTTHIEYWAGPRRLGVTPCGEDRTYVYLFCRNDDPKGTAIPFDVRSWSRWFPRERSLMERIPADEKPRSIGEVSCTSWFRGRVGILGDAAHAMAPNLGQGAGAAMQTALILVEKLDGSTDLETVFRSWEALRKPTVDRIQKASRIYDHMLTRWPKPLLDSRSAIAWGLPRSPQWKRLMDGTAQLD